MEQRKELNENPSKFTERMLPKRKRSIKTEANAGSEPLATVESVIEGG